MMLKYASMYDGHLEQVSVTKYRVKLTNETAPVYSNRYCVQTRQRQLGRDEVGETLKDNVAETATTEWASPIVFAPKKNCRLRSCANYRKLNAVTVRDSYLIPRMDTCIASFRSANVFSTLDASRGYLQIEMDDNDMDKTALVKHKGLFRYTQMPFGLKNAPVTFQRAMNIIMVPIKWQNALVYIDNIVIFSKSSKECLHHLESVLRLINKAVMILKLKKCFLFSDAIDYHGHVIAPRRLHIAIKTMDAVRDSRYPTRTSEMRSFLGLCNVYRQFIPNV